jgi:hypothetical protein
MPVQKPTLNLDEEYIQMALGLDLPEVELDGVSVEEAKRRAAAGHAALMVLKGTGEQPAWFQRFEYLLSKGLAWRQACYVAWASMPKEGRKPETQEELATKYLNLTSDRAISTWRRKNKSLDMMIAGMASFDLWEYRGDWFANLIKGMQKAGDDYKYFNHLKLYGEVTGDYVPLAQLAAVLKRKAEGGPHEVQEDVLNELAEGAEELGAMLTPTGLNIGGVSSADTTPSPEENAEEDDDAG